jgi:tetratricopeptide (TPR) repeat protein
MVDPLANLDLPPQALIDMALNLREMRETCGWSPEELAQMADLPVDRIRGYEEDPARLTHAVVSQVLQAMMARDTAERALGRSADPSRPSVLAQMKTRMLDMEAALRIDQRRFRQAQELLDQALALKPVPARKGRLLLSHAVVLGELRRERRALEDLEEASYCLDIAREPHLWLRLRLDQMYWLCRLERYEEAARWHGEARELMAQVGRDRERLELLCIEGWMAAGRGETAEAVSVLRSARRELLGADQLFSATALALDLAVLAAGQGDLDAVADLARELGVLTREKSLSQPSRSALKAFCWLVEHGRFDAPRGRRLAEEFRRGGCRLLMPYELPA